MVGRSLRVFVLVYTVVAFADDQRLKSRGERPLSGLFHVIVK